MSLILADLKFFLVTKTPFEAIYTQIFVNVISKRIWGTHPENWWVKLRRVARLGVSWFSHNIKCSTISEAKISHGVARLPKSSSHFLILGTQTTSANQTPLHSQQITSMGHPLHRWTMIQVGREIFCFSSTSTAGSPLTAAGATRRTGHFWSECILVFSIEACFYRGPTGKLVRNKSSKRCGFSLRNQRSIECWTAISNERSLRLYWFWSPSLLRANLRGRPSCSCPNWSLKLVVVLILITIWEPPN